MLRILALVLAAFLCSFPAAAASRVLTLDPDATEVRFHLGATGHDVDGAFELLSGELQFDGATGAASGEIRIDAAHAGTGNDKRDRTMHEKVLESERYPLFVFRAERVEGEVPESGTAELQVHGTVTVHGSDHPLTLPTTVAIDGERVTARTTFAVPFVAWGMKDPSWFVLRVAKEVEVTVDAAGHLGAEPLARATPLR